MRQRKEPAVLDVLCYAAAQKNKAAKAAAAAACAAVGVVSA